MQNEIVKLLKKEGKLSEKTIDELSNIEISDFSDLVRELGKEETKYIKRDKISKNLNTKYIGKDMYLKSKQKLEDDQVKIGNLLLVVFGCQLY